MAVPDERKLVSALRKAMDPAVLCAENFNSDTYLNTVLNAIRKSCHVSHIVLRSFAPRKVAKVPNGKDVPAIRELEIRGCAGFPGNKDGVYKYTSVEPTGPLVRRVKAIKHRGRYVYLQNLAEHPDFAQDDLVEQYNVGSCVACPIFSEQRFAGFIIYYKQNGYRDFREAERNFLASAVHRIVQDAFVLADQTDRSRKRLEFFKEVYDTSKLSFPEFEIQQYLKDVLAALAKWFGLPMIILRRRDPESQFKDILRAEATHGLPEKEVEKLDVRTDDGLAKELCQRTLNPDQCQWVYENDLRAPKYYAQKDFAGEHGLFSAVASPIVERPAPDSPEEFTGFVIHFSSELNGFPSKTEQNFLGTDLSIIIHGILVFASSLDKVRQQYVDLQAGRDYEEQVSHRPSESDKAYPYQYQGKYYRRLGEWGMAGDCFARSARKMCRDRGRGAGEKRSFIRDNLLDSAVAYARAGHLQPAEQTYKRFHLYFRRLSDGRGGQEDDERHFNAVIRAADSGGLDKLAGTAYVDKMKNRTRRFFWHGPLGGTVLKRAWSRAGSFVDCARYLVWGITAGYGERPVRFGVCMAVVISIFAVLYSLNALGVEWMELTADGGIFKSVEWAPWPIREWDGSIMWHNAVSAFSFSTAVFSTLGFGNVKPICKTAQIVVTIEVLFGYAFLGMFITIVARKFLRKIY